MTVKPYIAERIRQEPPCASVIAGSTPVLAFGDPLAARVATVGLNPSRVEFLDVDDRLFEEDKRRLATLTSLGARHFSNLSDEQIERLIGDCASYFSRNPYRRWFDRLEPMLNAFEASYYVGTACHLDLVQWATDPTWASLPTTDRRLLLKKDVSFLLSQLRNEKVEVALLNGRGVIRQFERCAGTRLAEVASISNGGHQPTRIFSGVLFDRVQVIGWSTNLQSSFGVTRERCRLLAEWLATQAAERLRSN